MVRVVLLFHLRLWHRRPGQDVSVGWGTMSRRRLRGGLLLPPAVPQLRERWVNKQVWFIIPFQVLLLNTQLLAAQDSSATPFSGHFILLHFQKLQWYNFLKLYMISRHCLTELSLRAIGVSQDNLDLFVANATEYARAAKKMSFCAFACIGRKSQESTTIHKLIVDKLEICWNLCKANTTSKFISWGHRQYIISMVGELNCSSGAT